MVARRFWVSLQQVIRSILIILFPLAFITLFAWATAGSTYGTTSDPMRAAVWLWLGAHLTPFNITSNEITGYLSFLPLGAALLPLLTMRIGFRRVVLILENKKLSRAYFILAYLFCYLILGLTASNSQVSVDWFRGLLILMILLLIATTTFRIEALVKLPYQMFLIMLGVAGLVFTFSLLANFSIAKNLTIVIHPGILGGALLFLLQILYLPNLYIATLSYVVGSGFSLGSATDLNPFVFDLREIPAIPVLAALPAGKYPWIIILTFMVLAYAVINLGRIEKLEIDDKSKQQLILRFFVISVFGSGVIAFLSSGSLISANMNPVGVNPLLISAVVLSHLVIAFLIIQFAPKIFNKKDKQSRLDS